MGNLNRIADLTITTVGHSGSGLSAVCFHVSLNALNCWIDLLSNHTHIYFVYSVFTTLYSASIFKKLRRYISLYSNILFRVMQCMINSYYIFYIVTEQLANDILLS